jgi:hypothetical protein
MYWVVTHFKSMGAVSAGVVYIEEQVSMKEKVIKMLH